MINFESLKAGFIIEKPAFFKNWLKNVIALESNKKPGEIQYIFCDDTYLLSINKKYLGHNTFTDIITFPTSKESDKVISGEIYISVDQVKVNARKYDENEITELSRVIVHGMLHLLGYNDQSASEKIRMKEKEDYYLNLQSQKIS
jgi:probable rRNA maturation factor